MGSTQCRDRRVVVLLDSEELERLDRAAERAGLARGTYIRHRLLYSPAVPVVAGGGEGEPSDAGAVATEELSA